MACKLTKKIVDELCPKTNSDAFIWCAELRGFGVRCKPSGTKTFIVQYRNARGSTRRYALGSSKRLTVDQARRLAKISLGNVEQGADPSAERKEHRCLMTITDLCQHYIDEARAGRVLYRGKPKAPGTVLIDEGRFRRHIKPLIGQLAIAEVTRKDVNMMMHAVRIGKTAVDEKTGPHGRARVRGGQGTAVKSVKLLSTIYTFAIKRGLVDDNPCRDIEKPADGRRTRFLSPEEYQRLGHALMQAPSLGLMQSAVDAIIVLALTGCRKTEVLSLQKSMIDVRGQCLRLKQTKTGPQMRPCGQPAMEFLTQLVEHRDDEDAWVFEAGRGGGQLVNVRKPLDRLCGVASVKDVTPHTLRHSFATVAHELNYSELTIAGLLGHSAGSVTARYAHHVDHALASAATHVASVIQERLRISRHTNDHRQSLRDDQVREGPITTVLMTGSSNSINGSHSAMSQQPSSKLRFDPFFRMRPRTGATHQ